MNSPFPEKTAYHFVSRSFFSFLKYFDSFTSFMKIIPSWSYPSFLLSACLVQTAIRENATGWTSAIMTNTSSICAALLAHCRTPVSDQAVELDRCRCGHLCYNHHLSSEYCYAKQCVSLPRLQTVALSQRLRPKLKFRGKRFIGLFAIKC